MYISCIYTTELLDFMMRKTRSKRDPNTNSVADDNDDNLSGSPRKMRRRTNDEYKDSKLVWIHCIRA